MTPRSRSFIRRSHPHAFRARWAPFLAVFILTALPGRWFESVASSATPRAYRGEITIPTYPWWPAVRHPYFRGTDRLNIYPYPMLDFLSREKIQRTYQTVVLENRYLRVTILPALGGKVHEVIDLTTGQPMFYVNNVIKPGLIGQCGGWTSGGIEWNTGPQGHTVSCLQPVAVEILPRNADGSQSVAIGETERIYGTRWTVVLTLRPDRSFLEERIRIHNPTELVRPYYFWNCTAVPNTPGFRFIYPMTLGTDHGAERFFRWPVHEGTDLSRGTNYQDASSIFAWDCDQDFFGSYNDDLRRGVVAWANHHQLPGKKAWTWGWGSYGTMHQMDLTDADGPYNEVQTGPLLTQGEVGRLDPGETISWQEWWYPVRDLDGFTYANRDVAVNAEVGDGHLRLRWLGTGTWKNVRWTVQRDGRQVTQGRAEVSPGAVTDVRVPLSEGSPSDQGPSPLVVTLAARTNLATFTVPLRLPDRQPPEKPPTPQSPSDWAQEGWRHYLFARFPESEAAYRRALDQDPRSVSALTGLAFLNLEREASAAARHAQAAVAADPDAGLAQYALAVARFREGLETEALDAAWLAARDPKVAGPARVLAARLLLRRPDYRATLETLSEAGPWLEIPAGRHLLGLAWLRLGDRERAAAQARAALDRDPLDIQARSLLWLAGARGAVRDLNTAIAADPRQLSELIISYHDLGEDAVALRLLREFAPTPATTDGPPAPRDPLWPYWKAYLSHRVEGAPSSPPGRDSNAASIPIPVDADFPHHGQAEPILRWTLKSNPADGRAALYLGHLLFARGRHAEGRQWWEHAARAGTEPSVAWRALGMAALTLDGDPDAAIRWLDQANRAAPEDAIVARDLARVLFRQADQAGEPRSEDSVRRARDVLQGAFVHGRGRSDFVALLARAHNRLGDYQATARLLDTVRITIWEGAREAHDLFQEAHLALAREHLQDGRPAEALREADRALEYPENLATGRLENAREAHVLVVRGQALRDLGRPEDAIATWRKAAQEKASDDPRHQEARRQARAALDQVGAGLDP